MHARRRLPALVSAGLLALGIFPVLVAPVAAATASDDASLRAAWAAPTEDLITLTADITLGCAPDQPERVADVDIVIEGNGYTITQPCDSDDALHADGLGTVTLRNVTLLGNPDADDGLDTKSAIVVENSTVSGFGVNGIESDGPVTVTSSTITENLEDGIAANDDVTVTSSTITDNGGDGIDTGVAGLTVTVSGSDVSDNGNDGIKNDGDITVTNSTVSRNAVDGIDSDDETDAQITVTASEVNENGEEGIGIDGDATIVSSSVSDNGDNGIRAGGDVSVTGSDVNDNGGAELVPQGISLDRNGISAIGAVTVTDSTVSSNLNHGISTMGDITVSGSTVDSNGQLGMYSEGKVSASGSSVSDNGGHGISVGGQASATVTNSTISGNGRNGISGGVVILSGSTVTGNGFPINGIEIDSSGDFGSLGSEKIGDGGVFTNEATITNSTITDNNAFGVLAFEDIFATYATVSGNGDNLVNLEVTTIHLFGSVVIDPDGGVNCNGVVDDLGHNFIDDDSCGDIEADEADPQLGALASNGGPTQTRLPADSSPLVDAIPDADCDDAVTTDQRLLDRPSQDGCDIGAVEVQAAPPPPTPAPDDDEEDELPDTAVPGTGTLLVTLAALLLIAGTIGLSAKRSRRLG